MENAIKCPVCQSKDPNCKFCGGAGFVVYEGGHYYSIELDAKNNPVKGVDIGTPLVKASSNVFLEKIFTQNEPHDMIWFFKEKKKQ